ncbi:hypothetical protein AB0H43_02990 [Hamadaea sp. NPDC050747]|uniref:hypothetical protein n=1 Tax=Hamadaea sp. NPDC050747 TaxID=3155789 RepID=UPI0033EDA27F
MTTFEHRRYPALILHDGEREWARFVEEKRTFGEHVVRVGVLKTNDADVIARLRAATDPDLKEIGGPVDEPDEPADDEPEAEAAPVAEPEAEAKPAATKTRSRR